MNIRVMKPNAVVMSAMKQPQNTNLSFFSELISLLSIVCFFSAKS